METELLRSSGFDFDLYQRNESMIAAGAKPPKATSTGTTIVGLVYEDGIVLGADTRATEGPIVADKNCEKIHYLAPDMYCCGAGTAADTEWMTALIRSNLHLQALENGKRKNRVVSALTMLKQRLFDHQGHIGAALILGGLDPVGGPMLFTIHPHGSTDKLPYTTMGSGSLAAMSIFESRYKPSLNKKDAVQLVSDAIMAGIFNDLGSGSNVDVVVLSQSSGIEILRNYNMPNIRSAKSKLYSYPRGTTVIIDEHVKFLKKDCHDNEAMDLS